MEELSTTSLADDNEEAMFSSKVGGTLRFSDPNGDDSVLGTSFSSEAGSESGATSSSAIRSWSKCSIPSTPISSTNNIVSPKRGPQRVTFEIISARTVEQRRKKFVSYTLLVKRVPGLERKPGVLERRYSDFLSLYQSLKKHYPSAWVDFPFPRKALLGNFTAEVITERSVAFQHLLAYAFSFKEMRFSNELAEFLYTRELHEAHRLMKSGQFEDASIIFENTYFVQEKALGEGHILTYTTICNLIACLNAVDNVSEAQKYAELALAQSRNHENSDLTLTLLVLSLRLFWAVGKDKRELEERVQAMRKSGINTDKLPTLLELVLKKEPPPVTRNGGNYN